MASRTQTEGPTTSRGLFGTVGVGLLVLGLIGVGILAVLAVLWARALGGHPHTRRLALALTLLYALSDEFHQAFVPGRTPDLLDLLCDGCGAVLGLLCWSWRQHRLEESGEVD